jgi:hypothetical protein
MRVTFLILVCIAFLGCGASNFYPRGKTLELPQPFPGGRVFVDNPGMTEEFAILRASGIFEISNDPDEAIHLTLHHRELRYGCGTPYVLTFMTFGLVPATMPADSVFSYSISDGGASQEFTFELGIIEKVSPLQYLFKPFTDEIETLGSVLRTEYANRYFDSSDTRADPKGTSNQPGKPTSNPMEPSGSP